MKINSLFDEMNFWERELEKISDERETAKKSYTPEAWIRSTAYFSYRNKIKKIKHELAKLTKKYFFLNGLKWQKLKLI